MAGKPYTMREMKTIVDYLVDHSAYGEVKARKMWVNFANSKVTNRTWQSLKETFLKRILPDIHNPYYKLTMEQILSFKQGYDVEKQERNKLEIQIVSDDSTTNAENQTDLEKPSTSNNNDGEKASGEDIKCSKIPSRNRSSADTLVLDNFYETAEEIQMELESPKSTDKPDNQDSVAKTLRDFITYSEPLTPMLQEVLDDFATESEGSDKEPQMEIVEEASPSSNNLDDNDHTPKSPNENTTTGNHSADVAKNAKGLASEVVEEVLLSEIQDTSSQLPKSSKSLKLKKNRSHSHSDTTENTNSIHVQVEDSVLPKEQIEENNISTKSSEVTEFFTAKNSTENTTIAENNSKNNSIDDKASGKNEKTTQNCSNSTNDTVLPNNQEALEKRTIQKRTQEEIKDTQEIFEIHAKSKDKTSQKRTNPNDIKANKKKKIEDNIKPIDTDSKRVTPEVEIISENGNSKKSENAECKHRNATQDTHDVVEVTDDITEVRCNINEPTENSKENEAEVVKSHPECKIQSNDSSQNENPCLKSVSLFAEQFNTTKYTDSDSSDVEIKTVKGDGSATVNKTDDAKDLVVDVINKDVVILKSHSDTESNHEEPPETKKPVDRVTKAQREQALANLFGFSSGVTSSRKRKLSDHRRSKSHRHSHSHKISESSEWTSETDSDMYVSPPRGRRNRQTRKYLKPHSARILSLEEEGGLFVMHGKKIYPLVKDGKIVKNYLTFLPESGSEEEEESYWRQKYVEERKRAEELKKLLDQAKEPKPRDTSSPILPSNTSRRLTSTRNQNKQSPQSSVSSNSKELSLVEHRGAENKNNHIEEKIKIKFTKNNEEVHLEGHWPQIHPVLEQVVQIFHKESDIKVNETKPKMVLASAEPSKEITSGQTTPISTVDPEVREKIDKIESEIFKEIEELDKEEQSIKNSGETNVTKRKGRARKVSSSTTSVQSPGKELKDSKQPDVKDEVKTATETRITESENGTTRRSKRNRTSKSNLNETALASTDTVTKRTRKSKLTELKVGNATVEDNDANVRYMLPPTKKPVRKSPVNHSKTKEQTPNRSSSKFTGSQNTLSRCSTESTQGYQDSDISPLKLYLQRRKRKMSVSTIVKNGKYKVRRKSYPLLAQDESDSSNSSYFMPVKKPNAVHSSLNSEVYKSESYQLLLPQQKRSSKRLEIIKETTPISNELNSTHVRHFNTVSRVDFDGNFKINNDKSDNSGHGNEVGSSSNVSLPQSPELSVVENLSVSKELLSTMADYATINETQANCATDQRLYNKYLISDVDVSVPLMEQECEFHKNNNVTNTKNNRIISAISESLLNKICSVNIEDNATLSDSLDRRLRDLLLESAKKMSKVQTNSQNNEVDMEVDISKIDTAKTTTTCAKKRCSTPRKKKTSKKVKVPKIDTVVEEEHMESYSHGGRKSCPPLIQVVSCQDIAAKTDDLDKDTNNEIQTDKTKSRKKKDVIKVKILRPREKSLSKEKQLDKSFENCSRVSACTDSGINDTESVVFCHGLDDSVDLIHNHSETCLHTNECVGDSVEFVETASKSIISVNSNSLPSRDSEWYQQNENNLANTIIEEMFCNNAQDIIHFRTEDKTNAEFMKTQSDTVYHTPLSTDCNSSLMTADLSDEIPTQKQSLPPTNNSKWYLLSEDESTNNNIHLPQGSMMSNFSAHLKQLFPIACAVPDLSTITEMSDNSRKPTLEDDVIN